MIGLSGIFTRKENSTNPNCMMSDNHLLARYNYDEFVPEKFKPWMNFSNSPPLGYPAPDFPVWQLDGGGTTLREIWSQNTFTIIEFGSFT